jgi:hypothetical protein
MLRCITFFCCVIGLTIICAPIVYAQNTACGSPHSHLREDAARGYLASHPCSYRKEASCVVFPLPVPHLS